MYTIDVDIIVLLLFIAIIPFILFGENMVISFLQHEYWNILSKPYFSYILIIQTSGTNILYRMNTVVDLGLYSISFFGVVNIIFTIILGSLLYTLFEVPFKKVNKFIMSQKNDNTIEEDNEDILEDEENVEKEEDSKLF